MTSIDILTRGRSVFGHIKMDLDKFIRQAGLDIQLNEITDIEEISQQNPPSVPYLSIEGHDPIYMEHGEYIHTFCSRARRWIAEAVGYGTMPRILVPIDFSEPSLNALRYAIRQYRGTYAVIDLLYAHMEVVGSVNDLPVVDTQVLGVLNDKMTRLVNSLMSDEGNKNLIIKGKIVSGPIVHTIVNTSQEVDKTMIYIGASGESGLMKSLFGSVTRQLVKKSTVPIFIIPPDYKGSTITNVGLTVSDPIQDAPIFKKLYHLIGSYNPTLHLIHSRRAEEEFDFEPYQALTKDFHNHLVKTMLLSDRDVVTNILKYINGNNFHLMVMTHYQRPLLASLFHKSIAKGVAAGIECPILIINNEGSSLDEQEEELYSESSY